MAYSRQSVPKLTAMCIEKGTKSAVPNSSRRPLKFSSINWCSVRRRCTGAKPRAEVNSLAAIMRDRSGPHRSPLRYDAQLSRMVPFRALTAFARLNSSATLFPSGDRFVPGNGQPLVDDGGGLRTFRPPIVMVAGGVSGSCDQQTPDAPRPTVPQASPLSRRAPARQMQAARS